MSVSGSDKEDPAACSTEETDREAQGLHAPQSPAPTEPAVPFDWGLEYEIPMEGLDIREARRMEDPELFVRPEGEIQGFHAPQAPPPESQAGIQTKGVEVRLKKLS